MNSEGIFIGCHNYRSSNRSESDPSVLFSVRTSLRMTFKAIVRVIPLSVDGPRVYCVGPHDIWFTCRHADTNLSRHK